MSFSTYGFIFIFLPLILIIYYMLPRQSLQRGCLILSACIFALSYNVMSLVLMAISLFINFIGSRVLLKSRRKEMLVLMVLFNVVFLGVFKYYNFFAMNANWLLGEIFPHLELPLPLGISFYTFQQIAYIVGVYKTGEGIESISGYAASVSFFPKLMSGPLLSHSETVKQFADPGRKVFDYSNLSAGLYIFCIGLFKKVVIANTVGLFADKGFSMVAGGLELDFFQAWCTALSYSFQIYFDFSGYSDMAVGIARMLGVELPFNFDSPYRSKGITEFWKKWHMTLTSTLTTLIYIPLGGNRKGRTRTYFNVMVVFLISGLWHGASWTFILWGLFHGIFSCLERMLKRWLEYIPLIIRKILTFLTVTLLWVMFRADSVRDCLEIYRKMFSLPNASPISISVLANDGIIPFPGILWCLYVIVFFLAIGFILCVRKNSNMMYAEFFPTKKKLIFTVVLFVISVIHLSRLDIFVYSNF